jgi:translation elongation factor EF-G
MVVMVPEEHLGTVLSDLTSQRRGQVKEVGSVQDSREITAVTPLACLMVSKMFQNNEK